MAMTFTLVTHVREQLSTILQDRVKKKKGEEAEKERQAHEVGVISSAYFPRIHRLYLIIPIYNVPSGGLSTRRRRKLKHAVHR